jgi:hypothetical protein
MYAPGVMRVAASNLLQQGTCLMAEPWVSVENVAKHFGVVKETTCRWIEIKGREGDRGW